MGLVDVKANSEESHDYKRLRDSFDDDHQYFSRELLSKITTGSGVSLLTIIGFMFGTDSSAETISFFLPSVWFLLFCVGLCGMVYFFASNAGRQKSREHNGFMNADSYLNAARQQIRQLEKLQGINKGWRMMKDGFDKEPLNLKDLPDLYVISGYVEDVDGHLDKAIASDDQRKIDGKLGDKYFRYADYCLMLACIFFLLAVIIPLVKLSMKLL